MPAAPLVEPQTGLTSLWMSGASWFTIRAALTKGWSRNLVARRRGSGTEGTHGCSSHRGDDRVACLGTGTARRNHRSRLLTPRPAVRSGRNLPRSRRIIGTAAQVGQRNTLFRLGSMTKPATVGIAPTLAKAN